MNEEFDNNEVERVHDSEKVMERQFKNPYLGALYKLVDSDIFRYTARPHLGRRSSFRHRQELLTADSKKALTVLATIPELHTSESEKKDPIASDEILRQKAIDAYYVMLNLFLAEGVITSDLEEQIKRLTTPDDVVTREKQSELLYEDYVFPQDEKDRAKLIVSYGSIRRMAEKIRQTATTVGVPLTDEQIEQAAFCELIAHEYGHAIESTVRLLKVERATGGSNSQSSSNQEDVTETLLKKQRIFRSVTSDMNKELSRIIFDPEIDLPASSDPLAPQHSANVLYRDWTRGTHSINRERVGSGFEYWGLRLVLKSLGLTPEQASVIVRNIKGDVRAEFNELVLTDQHIRNKGIRLADLDQALKQLQSLPEVKRAGLENHIPVNFHFPLGYSKPVSEEHLKQYLTSCLSS